MNKEIRKKFFKIENFSDYLINKEGCVYNTKLKMFLVGSRNPAGYWNFRLKNDAGDTYTWGRHRLLAFVFKRPKTDIIGLVVNHINGIKGDDRLDNLEWVTYKRNVEHAGETGMTSKCTPISVRNIDTGEIIDFPSIVECSRQLGVSKDFISWRVKKGEKFIFPERKQYRYKTDTKWYIPSNLELKTIPNGRNRKVSILFLKTNKIEMFNSSKEVAEYLGVAQSTISIWLGNVDRPVLPGFIQIKFSDDPIPWRKIDDLYIELYKFTKIRPIKVINEITGNFKIYTSNKECMLDINLKPSTLSARLKTNFKKTFNGLRFGYYYPTESN